jgi:4-aminobutyrate aminotransferase/(S)-3-amino-2-methylpropionate transaminase
MSTINLITNIPGPKSLAMLERRKNALPAGLAKSTEVVVDKAEGGVVWDADGNTLLDFAGGIGMINVGHRPEQITNAIKAQLDKYIHTCSLVTTFEPYIELAEMLNRLVPGDFTKKTLLCNTGTEAVENAVMLARYYTKRPGIICFEGAYHGRSLLTLSLTSKYSLFKKGFGSFASDIYRLPVPNFYRIPKGISEDEYLDWSIKNLEHAFIAQVDPESVAAFIIEPVLGEGGFIQMPAPFMQKIRDLCDKYGIVMIADEIQSGSGRTGRLFAIEHTGVVPDVMTIAKSLGAGMPVSAVVGKAEIMDCTHLGGVGGTYGGSPVAAVAAIEALKILSSQDFLQRANHVGNLIKSTLDAWKAKYELVGDVRAIGAMCIVEFVKDKNTKEPDLEIPLEVLKDAVAHGIILIRAGLYSNCIRLLPPIVMTDDQLHEGLQVLEDAIARAHEKRGK